MKEELRRALPMAEAFSKILHPFAECVVHDLETDQIKAIFNPISKRKVGDSSYLDRVDFTHDPEENVIGPYEKMNFDGRRMKSISVVLRDEGLKAVGFLCVNIDISVFERFQDTIQLFLGNAENEVLFKEDLYDQMSRYVQSYLVKERLSFETLGRKDKQAIVLQLKGKGALSGKNATSYIARILSISRATVYNYLGEEK